MEIYAERRRRLLEILRGVAIVGSMPVASRNSDVEHPYRQDSDLYYFTGYEEPDAVLVMTSAHPEHRSVVFVRPRDAEREKWDGARSGVEGAREQLGVDAAFPIAELPVRLPEYLSGTTEVHYAVGYRPRLDEQVLRSMVQARARARSPLPRPRRLIHPEETWHEMRLRKGEDEIALMSQAAQISAEAHLAAMRAVRPGMHEYELEAVLRSTYRRRGSDRVAFEPIVASGPNATVLHYVSNRRAMQEGDLVLVDAGCEWGYYASDITRTFPVSGRFTEAQRRIYQLVLDAHGAAVEATRPGVTLDAVHAAALGVLVEGMLRLGLLAGTAEVLIAEEGYKRLFWHRTSHWLGMDVHDVGNYYLDGQSRLLEPGMVLTIEPGIYVGVDDDSAPAEYRGIGVRIEDALVVTPTGYENLTESLPRSVEEVERACRS